MPVLQRPWRLFGAVIAGGVVLAGAGVAYHQGLIFDRSEQHWAVVQSYCTECHNAAEATGDLVLEGLSPEAIPEKAEVFEAAVRKLRGRQMPPPGNPQPEQRALDGLVSFIEESIDEHAPELAAGHVPIQRLNRTEYALAVQDLLGVEIDAAKYLPNEIEVDGFTNIAAALSVSPAFLEQYISVARTVARLAIGEEKPKLASAYFPPPGGDQDGYVDGMPLGTRGGTSFKHSFPADGEYRITLTDLDVGLYPRSLETEHTLVMLLDRAEVFRAKLGGASGSRARRSRRRAGARANHAALRQHPRASHGRRARGGGHVHRARTRVHRRADLRVHPVRRLQLHGHDARAARDWRNSARGSVRPHGVVAHRKPREVLRLPARD